MAKKTTEKSVASEAAKTAKKMVQAPSSKRPLQKIEAKAAVLVAIKRLKESLSALVSKEKEAGKEILEAAKSLYDRMVAGVVTESKLPITIIKTALGTWLVYGSGNSVERSKKHGWTYRFASTCRTDFRGADDFIGNTWCFEFDTKEAATDFVKYLEYQMRTWEENVGKSSNEEAFNKLNLLSSREINEIAEGMWAEALVSGTENLEDVTKAAESSVREYIS